MYLWNISALAHDLRENKVSESEKMHYFLFLTIFETLFHGSGSRGSASFALMMDIVFALITIFGILKCYAINKRGDNRGFIERFICLSLPAMIRTVLLALLMVILAFLLVVVPIKIFAPNATIDRNAPLITILATIITLPVIIYYYHLLFKNFRLVAQKAA